MNTVALIGNVANEIELASTKNGTSVIDFTLAVADGFGENKQTYFLDISVFGTMAESMVKFVGKGSKVAVVGKLTTQLWETKDGKKAKAYKIIAQQLEFISPKTKTETKEVKDEDYPF